MKSFITATFAVIAAFQLLTGCRDQKNAARLKAEVGKGTFVSAKGDAITALHYADDTVRLEFQDKTAVELCLAVSASGARYTNHTAEWWEHHGEATYDIRGTNVFLGKILGSK